MSSRVSISPTVFRVGVTISVGVALVLWYRWKRSKIITSVRPGINDAFETPGEPELCLQRFEVESREIFRQHRHLIPLLPIPEGASVMDLGAGTGLMMGPLANAVGRFGTVYACDPAAKFQPFLRSRAQSLGLSEKRVRVLQSTHTSVDDIVPSQSMDVVFCCDTYHHFEYPDVILPSIRRILKTSTSRFIVIDFERIPGVSNEWVMGHVRCGKEVVLQEIIRNGFILEREMTGILKENYILIFQRGDEPPSTSTS